MGRNEGQERAFVSLLSPPRPTSSGAGHFGWGATDRQTMQRTQSPGEPPEFQASVGRRQAEGRNGMLGTPPWEMSYSQAAELLNGGRGDDREPSTATTNTNRALPASLTAKDGLPSSALDHHHPLFSALTRDFDADLDRLSSFSSSFRDRDPIVPNSWRSPVPPSATPSLTSGDTFSVVSPTSTSPIGQRSSDQSRITAGSTLWWGELEPWMDEEYIKSVCNVMNWDPVSINIPSVPQARFSLQQPNNPGYCYLTFNTSQEASNVLSQANNPGPDSRTTMPNTSKPFVLNWAAPSATSSSSHSINNAAASPQPVSTTQKEYSIFVGDLAPETSNSDLVAVFRNPVLGLRNDRAPKFIRPFASCKSAKIMLDPATGVSRGYGFVRFTDEADQQRALVEMHGLYCLSRPMRISPATAKFKPPASESAPVSANSGYGGDIIQNSAPSLAISASVPSLTSSATASSVASNNNNNANPALLSEALVQLFTAAGVEPPKIPQIPVPPSAAHDLPQLYGFPNEESWKHTEQARAILSNLIGPNGEQLTSTDPYNTTVFVGGLSPLISEETLRTFFAPFGDIHYVKVPVGKHCGFVQFVRKADAERAIERMQGYPIGGSRIRLSWGRSQYKAAQAAAQAAVAAHAQTSNPSAAPPPPTSPVNNMNITGEQALDILQKLGFGNAASGEVLPDPSLLALNESFIRAAAQAHVKAAQATNMNNNMNPFMHQFEPGAGFAQEHMPRPPPFPAFSPFSPDPNHLQREVSAIQGGAFSDSFINGNGENGALNNSAPRFGPNTRMASPPAGGFGSAVSANSNSNKQQQPPINTFPSWLVKPQSPNAPAGGLMGRFRLNTPDLRGPQSLLRPMSNQKAKGPATDDQDFADINGTLASLELDSSMSPSSSRSRGEVSDSSESVQFRVSMNSPATTP